jgi:hypothetical protein
MEVHQTIIVLSVQIYQECNAHRASPLHLCLLDSGELVLRLSLGACPWKLASQLAQQPSQHVHRNTLKSTVETVILTLIAPDWNVESAHL